MSITVTNDVTAETHTYRRGLGLAGVEPMTVEGRTYSHGGKQFLPDYAFAGWDHGEPITSISLRGAVLKKDGTPGKDRTDVSYITPANKLWGAGYSYPEAPAWLLELFDIEMPE